MLARLWVLKAIAALVCISSFVALFSFTYTFKENHWTTRHKPSWWLTLNTSLYLVNDSHTCQNSAQGKVLVVDSEGSLTPLYVFFVGVGGVVLIRS